MVNIIPYDKNIEDYIKMVFNYFNGKINTVNPAHLTIDWVGKYYYYQYIAAYTILPNRVFFNPMVISRYCPSEEYLKFQIVEFMIHELFHTDQVIQYKRMVDEYYKHDIEAAVEKQTALYMKEHIEEIKANLGVYVDSGCMRYLDELLDMNKYYMHPYERRTPADHLWMIVDQFTPISQDTTEIRNMINSAVSNNAKLVIILNGDNHIIIDLPYLSQRDVIQFSNMDFFDKFDGSITKASVNAYYDNSGALIIDIKAIIYKNLCLVSPKTAIKTL